MENPWGAAKMLLHGKSDLKICEKLQSRAGVSSPARNLLFRTHIYRHYLSWHSPEITSKLSLTRLQLAGRLLEHFPGTLALGNFILSKDKISLAVGGVLLQTCPGLPSRQPLSGIHLPGAHQVDISPLSAIPQFFGLGEGRISFCCLA